jgi:hypothetical protein
LTTLSIFFPPSIILPKKIVDYPSTWTVAENNPDLVLRVKDVVVNFFSPPKDFSDVSIYYVVI